jgi:coenzyme F420-reducing hydrogenase gamma subunit
MGMKITSKVVCQVATEKDGKLSSVKVSIGEHSYSELDITNERTVEDLRMLQDDMDLIKVEGGIPDKEAREALKKKREKRAKKQAKPKQTAKKTEPKVSEK